MTQAPSPPPPPRTPSVQEAGPTQEDNTHLTLLTVFYYIMAAFAAVGICIGTLYLFMSRMIISDVRTTGGSSGDEIAGNVIMIFGVAAIILSIALGILYAMCAYGISKRKWKMLTYIMAGFSCLSIPIGTALGVYTFIVLARPGVTAMYAQQPAQRPPLQG